MTLTYKNCSINILENGRVIRLLDLFGLPIESFELSIEEFNSYQKTVLDKISMRLQEPIDYSQVKNALSIQKFIELVD